MALPFTYAAWAAPRDALGIAMATTAKVIAKASMANRMARPSVAAIDRDDAARAPKRHRDQQSL
jgi:hypothetical protein